MFLMHRCTRAAVTARKEKINGRRAELSIVSEGSSGSRGDRWF